MEAGVTGDETKRLDEKDGTGVVASGGQGGIGEVVPPGGGLSLSFLYHFHILTPSPSVCYYLSRRVSVRLPSVAQRRHHARN